MGPCTAIIVHPLFLHSLSLPPEQGVVVRFQSLPPEIVALICLQLDSAKDLCNVSAVNTECRSVAGDDSLWKPLCQRHFLVPAYAEPESWRELYKFNHQTFKELLIKGWLEQIDSLGGPIQLPNNVFF